MCKLTIYNEENQKLGNVNFIKSISNQIKIKDISSEDFTNHLVKNIVLIHNLTGIKEPISDVNKKDIKELLLTKYKNLSLDEISYAFKLERYNELGDRTHHYQLFDASYVSDVLDKYQKWKSETILKHKINNLQIPKKTELTEEEKEEIVIKGLIEAYNYFKKNGEIMTGKAHLYLWLFKKGLMPKDNDSIDRVKRIAKNRFKQIDSLPNKSLSDVKKYVKEIQGIETNTFNLKCREISLELFFNKYKKEEDLIKEIKKL